MTVIRAAASLAVVTMAVAIGWGLATGDFWADGTALLGLAWGKVTMVDLYLAFGGAWAWIAWRERSVVRAIAWAVLVAGLGSLAIWGYVWWAARSADDVPALLVGPERAATS